MPKLGPDLPLKVSQVGLCRESDPNVAPESGRRNVPDLARDEGKASWDVRLRTNA